MLRIRQRGGFGPWGSAVGAVEMALWDIAGKAAGLPVYKLLGGKVRDRVRVYNGAVRFPMTGYEPADFAENMAKMKASPEGFTIIKQGIGFHSAMKTEVPDLFYGEPPASVFHGQLVRGLLTERGLKHIVACVEAMKEVLGDKVGLALDCGPGWTVPDAMVSPPSFRFAPCFPITPSPSNTPPATPPGGMTSATVCPTRS